MRPPGRVVAARLRAKRVRIGLNVPRGTFRRPAVPRARGDASPFLPFTLMFHVEHCGIDRRLPRSTPLLSRCSSAFRIRSAFRRFRFRDGAASLRQRFWATSFRAPLMWRKDGSLQSVVGRCGRRYNIFRVEESGGLGALGWAPSTPHDDKGFLSMGPLFRVRSDAEPGPRSDAGRLAR